MSSGTTRPVIWLKHRMRRRDAEHLMKIMSGVARSYNSSDRKFGIINLATGYKNIFTKNNVEWSVSGYQVLTGNEHEKQVQLITELKNSNYTNYLCGEKLNLNEKLTKEDNLKIICIYVTLSRKIFSGIDGDSITRCLINLKAASCRRAEPVSASDIEWTTR